MDFRALSEIHDLWLPEALFYEALTTDKAQNRARCFALIQSMARRPSITTNIGKLLALEMQQRVPIDPVTGDWSDVTWPWKPNLADAAYDISSLLNFVTPWREEIRRNILAFVGVAGDVKGLYPILSQMKGGGSTQEIEHLLDDVARRPDLIRAIYAAVSTSDDVASSKIGPNWMSFRVFQAAFLNAIEHIRKYGDKSLELGTSIPKQVENSYVDMEYMTVATFADGIVSNDARLVHLHKKMTIDTRVFRTVREALFCSCSERPVWVSVSTLMRRS